MPRAALPDGRGVDILSPFGRETLAADQRAFAAMMAHLEQVDGAANTVLMVQVENEIGMLPVARDYSPPANAAFAEPVPAELVGYLVAHRDTLVPGMRRMWLERGAGTSGSWAELFGEGDPAAEVFTAWHFASFVDIVAGYHRADNPLFIPEGHNADNPTGPANAVYAIAAHDAIGFAPFSIDSIDDRPNAFGEAYDMLAQLAPFILAAQGTGRMMGFRPRQNYDDSLNFEPVVKLIGDYRFTVAYADIRVPVATPETAGYGDQTHQGCHIRLPAGKWQIQDVKLYSYN